jgi:hypothetical protein
MDDVAPEEWQVVEGKGWITIPGFGKINPRSDNVNGGRHCFDADTIDDESAQVTGASIEGGPGTWFFGPDQPFLLADYEGTCLEVEVSNIGRGRYAVKYRPGIWPSGGGAW